MAKAFDRAGIVLGALCVALGVFVIGVQSGIWWARTNLFAPVTLTARPCIENRAENCFVDARGKEMRIRVRGDEAQPYYPASQEQTP